MSVQSNLGVYKDIKSMIDMMDQEVKSLKNTYASSVFGTTGIPVTPSVFDAVLPYSIDNINEMDIIDIKKVLEPYEILDGDNPSKLVELDDDSIRGAMIEIKKLSLALLQIERDSDKIKKESSDVMNEYIGYITSKNIIKNKEDKIKLYKEANELESDEAVKRANSRQIKVLENEISYGFLTERLRTLGTKEKENVINKFFDNGPRGEVIVKKFKSHIKQFGYNPDIFTHFLNIEESFLPEEYHPFNNLFLSIYMNYVGCASYDIKSDRIYVASITTAISSLIYHTFADPADETRFIEFIKSVIDLFKDDIDNGPRYIDMFKLSNRSYKYHPDRVMFEKAREDIAKNTILKKFEDLNIENPYDEDTDIETLKTYLNEKIEELKDEQLKLHESLEEIKNEDVDNAEKVYESVKDKIEIINDDKTEDVIDSIVDATESLDLDDTYKSNEE